MGCQHGSLRESDRWQSLVDNRQRSALALLVFTKIWVAMLGHSYMHFAQGFWGKRTPELMKVNPSSDAFLGVDQVRIHEIEDIDYASFHLWCVVSGFLLPFFEGDKAS